MTGFLTFLGAGVLLVIGGAYALAKVVQRQRAAHEAWRREFLSPVVEHGSPSALRREGLL